jgi:hypothetical protein
MKWFDVKERLPPIDVCVICNTLDPRKNKTLYPINRNSVMTCYRVSSSQWCDSNNGEVLDSKYNIVTHWMFIPDNIETEKLVEFNETQ